MKKIVTPRIKASKRPKKRYVLFQLKSSEPLSFFGVKSFFLKFFENQFGSSFEEKMLKFVLFDSKTGYGVIRCRHLSVDQVKASISLVKRVGSFPVESRVVLVSGSIKKLKGKISPKKNLKKSVQ